MQQFLNEKDVGLDIEGINSGRQGKGLIYYATGRSAIEPKSSESIQFVEYDGFSNTYTSKEKIDRTWNWTSFHGTSNLLIAFGTSSLSSFPANASPTNPNKTIMNLIDLTCSATSWHPCIRRQDPKAAGSIYQGVCHA